MLRKDLPRGPRRSAASRTDERVRERESEGRRALMHLRRSGVRCRRAGAVAGSGVSERGSSERAAGLSNGGGC
ncbi:hypothetical protein R5R35_012916 [Gryllus longicercus]|uniref:Uncharacterized protein n=1 Tax=Gryllus longicercus TaxID=2509291 RepID=A0AAN9YZW6_9ORTH